MLEGVIIVGCTLTELSSSNCAGGDFLSFRTGALDRTGDDEGVGNLNSRFMTPLRLFRFDSVLVERSSWTSSVSSSSAASSGVGSNAVDLAWFSGLIG